MNVYIGGTKDYSAMRGPCPEGFHIPMKDEWVGVNSIMAALGNTTVNSYISKLHLHLGRFIEWQGTKYPDEPQIGYWSCTKYANNNYAYALFLYTYNGTEIVSPNQQFQKNKGFPIRPFKDTFVTPTASWTVIQGTLGSAGIFWNTTKGIISITGDGTTGYTITDKDLGATTVYNSGDTKTDANCGKCYQWGNIYGFTFNSFTTSSTQVNASNYGPGNYYSSSTFITTDPRDSSNNANLWGGATGIVSFAELKNAYIGEVYEYSYDFRNKTLSQITADGWDYSAGGTPYFTSNGVYGDFVRLVYDISSHISNAKKITIQFSASAISESGGGVRLAKRVTSSSRVGVTGPGHNGSRETYMYIYDTMNSYSGLSSGTYTFNGVINLAAKTWSLSITGKPTQTGTITDTQVSNILNNTTKLFVFSAGNSSSAAVSDLKLTIE